MNGRTDLAMEEHALWKRAAGRQTKLRGVKARSEKVEGIVLTTVEILDESGEKALGKPRGVYVSLEGGLRHDAAEGAAQVRLLARQIRGMLPAHGTVLVAGLGNEAVTPDALGPETVRNLIVTRHLKQKMPELFSPFATVCALCPGVLGTTGVESAEWLMAAVRQLGVDAVIAVDALAGCAAERVCKTVQISTAGITPGSGVGNAREAINRTTLGVPVLAIGAPTVMDVGGRQTKEGTIPEGMIVIPRDIDAKIKLLGRWIGLGIDLALHEGLDVETAMDFLS